MNKRFTRRIILCLSLSCILLVASCSEKRGSRQESSEAVPQEESSRHERKDIPAGAQALLDAYPDFITDYRDGFLIFRDGDKMRYDDGRKKSFVQQLDESDAEDMFSVLYREPKNAPGYLEDAGRSRCEALFKKMYGDSESAVRKNLRKVSWFGERVDFADVNGAADSLERVAAELKNHPELHKYLKSSGTFLWRSVRGARRQSAHSYGIAFDVAVAYSDYWRWKNPGAGETDKIQYANKIPRELVRIFRRHGFIWGGAWYHFDTMHFEFRPEILRYAELKVEN